MNGRRWLALAAVIALILVAGGFWTARHWDELTRHDRLHAAIAPDSSYAYVASSTPGTIMVLSLRENRQLDRFGVPGHITGMVFHPDGRSAYVLTAGGEGQLHVIDTASRKVRKTISVGQCADSIAISADGRALTIAEIFPNDLCVTRVDTATLAVTVRLARSPIDMASWGVLARDASRVYIPGCGPCQHGGMAGPGEMVYSIEILSPMAGVDTVSIPLFELGPRLFDVSPDNARIAIYTENRQDKWEWGVAFVDTASGVVTGPIPVAEMRYRLGLNFSSDGKWVFVLHDVSASAPPTLFTIDAATGREHSRLAVHVRGAQQIVNSPDASRILLMQRSALGDADEVTVIDTRKNAVVATVQLEASMAQRVLEAIAQRVTTLRGPPKQEPILVE